MVRRLSRLVCMALLLQALAPALALAGVRQALPALVLVQPICSAAGNHAPEMVVFEREAAASEDTAPATPGPHCALCMLPLPALLTARPAATGPPRVDGIVVVPVDARLVPRRRLAWRHGRPRAPPRAA